MKENRNILLIAYYFPPLGMGGVGRPLGLVKYLPEFGYDVTVLTVKNISFPNYDYSLIDEEMEGSVFRSGSLDPSRLMYILGKRKIGSAAGFKKAASLINFPDNKRLWNFFAWKKAKSIIENLKISAFITTAPPPSTHILGMKIKNKFNIPWIADFRDFWFSLPIELIYSTGRQKSLALRLKNDIVNSADNIVCVNNSIKSYLGRGEVITNGADPDAAGFWQRPPQNSGTFTIGILGTINYLCPVEPLFMAVSRLLERHADLTEKISILHVGGCDKSEMNHLLEKYSLERNVILKGYLPRSEAIKTIARSDILYFSVADFEGYHIVPGRIFDYLSSGKPITGAVPPKSEAEQFINNYGLGKTFNSGEIEPLADAILDYVEKFAGGWQPDLRIDENKYSTRFMAEKYAQLIDKMIA